MKVLPFQQGDRLSEKGEEVRKVLQIEVESPDVEHRVVTVCGIHHKVVKSAVAKDCCGNFFRSLNASDNFVGRKSCSIVTVIDKHWNTLLGPLHVHFRLPEFLEQILEALNGT